MAVTVYSCFTVRVIVLLFLQSSMITATKQPHILFILADDYGYNDVGYHGSEIKTPNLDRLANEGVKLENYYVQPICTPTRSQLLSGRYQIHTGLQHGVLMPTVPNALLRDSPILPEKLKDVGYKTHMVGKWHLGFYKEEFVPTQRGFDSFFGYYGGMEDYYTHGVAGHFGYYGYDLRTNDTVDWTANGTYSTYLFAQRTIDIVKKHDPSKPLFLYLAFQAVHAPLEVPAKYEAPYSFIKDTNRRTYAGMVSCMDEAIGNVTAAFQQYGLWDNTVLIFSTDNGGQVFEGGNNYPLRGWKGSLWEGGMKGVGFVHSNLIPNGTVNRELIHVSDWFPTLVNLAGGSLNGTKPLDGYDQWATVSKGVPSKRNELLHNIDILYPRFGLPVYNQTFDSSVRGAIRVGDWKLITGNPGNGSWIPQPHLSYEWAPAFEADGGTALRFTPVHNVWLFNITADPNEHVDLSASYPHVVKHLLDRLQFYNSTAVPPRFPDPDPKSNPATHGGAWGPWE